MACATRLALFLTVMTQIQRFPMYLAGLFQYPLKSGRAIARQAAISGWTG